MRAFMPVFGPRSPWRFVSDLQADQRAMRTLIAMMSKTTILKVRPTVTSSCKRISRVAEAGYAERRPAVRIALISHARLDNH